MDLSIIIVSWNVQHLITKCLDSIIARPITIIGANGDIPVYDGYAVEIIVVDSASSDETVRIVREKYPDVILLAQSENVGFTRGNNIGLEGARGRNLLLLNPDTEIIDDALEKMIVYLDSHPNVGIVGPYTLNTDGTPQSTRRRFPNRLTAFFESTWLQPLAPATLLDNYYVSDLDNLDTGAVDWVQGSALMARREVYETIGGLDTGYVMFFEETDWCKQAKDAGWDVVYLGSAQIIHHSGASSAQAGARKHIHFQESKIRYFSKHDSRLFAQVLRLFLLVQYSWQLTIESLKWLLGHKRDLRKSRMDIYHQVLASGLRLK